MQLVRLGAREAIVRRVDEDTVGAGVFDEVLAVQIADQGVPAGDVRIRKHPVVVRQAADRAADGIEDLAAARAQVLGLLADDFQREDHGVGLFLQCRSLDSYGTTWSIAVSARGLQQL